MSICFLFQYIVPAAVYIKDSKEMWKTAKHKQKRDTLFFLNHGTFPFHNRCGSMGHYQLESSYTNQHTDNVQRVRFEGKAVINKTLVEDGMSFLMYPIPNNLKASLGIFD